jgi:hypothetical protein
MWLALPVFPVSSDLPQSLHRRALERRTLGLTSRTGGAIEMHVRLLRDAYRSRPVHDAGMGAADEHERVQLRVVERVPEVLARVERHHQAVGVDWRRRRPDQQTSSRCMGGLTF